MFFAASLVLKTEDSDNLVERFIQTRFSLLCIHLEDPKETNKAEDEMKLCIVENEVCITAVDAEPRMIFVPSQSY